MPFVIRVVQPVLAQLLIDTRRRPWYWARLIDDIQKGGIARAVSRIIDGVGR